MGGVKGIESEGPRLCKGPVCVERTLIMHKMSKKGGKVAGAAKFKLGQKPPKQSKVKGISTPFSNRIMSGGGR